jgi:hypothetical protein
VALRTSVSEVRRRVVPALTYRKVVVTLHTQLLGAVQYLHCCGLTLYQRLFLPGKPATRMHTPKPLTSKKSYAAPAECVYAWQYSRARAPCS